MKKSTPIVIILFFSLLLFTDCSKENSNEPEIIKIIKLLSPNGGEIFHSDSTVDITWVSENIDKIKIQYSIDYFDNWILLKDSVSANKEKIKVQFPNISADSVKLKIEDLNNSGIFDESDAFFSIKDDPIVQTNYDLEIIEPFDSIYINPYEISIKWNCEDSFNRFSIYYSKFSDTLIHSGYPDNKTEYSSEWILLKENIVGSQREYIWRDPSLYSNKVKIKAIGFSANEQIEATNRNVFTVNSEELLTLEKQFLEKYEVGNRWVYQVSIEEWGMDIRKYYLINDVASSYSVEDEKYFNIEQKIIKDSISYSYIKVKDREHYSPSYILQNGDVFSIDHYTSNNENWVVSNLHSETRTYMNEQVFSQMRLVSEDYIYDSGSGISSDRIKRIKDAGMYYRKSDRESYYVTSTLIGAVINGIVYGDTSLAF